MAERSTASFSVGHTWRSTAEPNSATSDATAAAVAALACSDFILSP